MSVGIGYDGSTLDSLSDSNDVRDKVELEVILNERWRSGVNKYLCKFVCFVESCLE